MSYHCLSLFSWQQVSCFCESFQTSVLNHPPFRVLNRDYLEFLGPKSEPFDDSINWSQWSSSKCITIYLWRGRPPCGRGDLWVIMYPKVCVTWLTLWPMFLANDIPPRVEFPICAPSTRQSYLPFPFYKKKKQNWQENCTIASVLRFVSTIWDK